MDVWKSAFGGSLSIVRSGGLQMLELKIVEHCAPTLAGLKTGNLFNYRFSSIDMLHREIQEGSEKLNRKGVFIEVLKISDIHALVYVYRKKKLEADLKKEGVGKLLASCGYVDQRVDGCLEHLKEQFARNECFPHEIGVFLSYPLSDVIGFIEQKGKNCKYCGIWKVYGDEQEALELFQKFKKCTDVYRRIFANGRSITQLTVAA